MNKTITITIVALVIIIGGYFIFQGEYQTPQEPSMQTPSLGVPAPGFESIPETVVVKNKNSVVANNQLRGNSVTVTSIQLVGPGYVIIHEDAGGKPGPTIGNSGLLEEGSDVVIPLKRGSKTGETLYVILHKDDGDGVYEFPGDDVPLKDEDGKVVLSKFLILARAVEAIPPTTFACQKDYKPICGTDNVTYSNSCFSKQAGVGVQYSGECKIVTPTHAPSVKEISMVSGNLFFNPKNLALVRGQPVRITFQNTGTHTFTIDELGVNVALRGSSGVAEFTPTQSGTFEYYCSVPGHREGGMFGSLTVE